jgi:hypothetical protein
MKDGFNAAGVKYFHVWLCFASIFAVGVVTFAKYYNTDNRDTDLGKRNFPGYKYFFAYLGMPSCPNGEDMEPMTTCCKSSKERREG